MTQHVSQLSKGSVLNIWFISELNNGFACTLNVFSTVPASSLPGLCWIGTMYKLPLNRRVKLMSEFCLWRFWGNQKSDSYNCNVQQCLEETLLPWIWKESIIWLVSLSQQQLKTDPSKVTRAAKTSSCSHSLPDRSLVLPGHGAQTASQIHALPCIWLFFTAINKGSGVKNHRV